MWVLFIIIFGVHPDYNNSISSQVGFESKNACEVAGMYIKNKRDIVQYYCISLKD